MKRKILASNPKFCLVPVEKALRQVEQEFQGWEIMMEKYQGWEFKDEVTDVLSTTDIHIQVHAPLNDINLASINPNIREASVEEVEKSIKLASMIGAEIVTVHPGLYSPLSFYCDNVLDISKRSLGRLMKTAEDLDISLAVENMPEMWLTLCSEPEEMKEVLDDLNIDLCLDIGHAYTANRLDDFLEFTPINVHIHDNIGERDKPLPLGEGHIDFGKVMKSLEDYKGNLVIEGRKLEELIESKRFLKRLIND